MDRPESAPHVGVLRPGDRAFPLLAVVACSFAWLDAISARRDWVAV
jgi:hypothetical protein